MIPGAANPLLLASAAGAAGYQIERSIRLNAPDSAYLSRTPSVAGNRKTWTWAGWVKKAGGGSSTQNLFSNMNGANSTGIYTNFVTSLSVQDYAGGTIWGLTSVALYRDFSAWYHIVVAVDTTVATETDRVKLFVNGERIAVTGIYPGQDTDTRWNTTATITLGTQGLVLANYFNGYLADVYGIDGQALDPTSFGEFDANGVWQPKAYTGTYGTNGFHLDFADNSAATTAGIGKDVSGNGNDWTPVNLSVAAGAANDSLVDTPTSYGTDDGLGGSVRGNYCTINPIDLVGTNITISNGNLQLTTASSSHRRVRGTMAVSSGKWYMEGTLVSGGSSYPWIGIIATSEIDPNTTIGTGDSYAYGGGGQKRYNGVTENYGATFSTGSIIGAALDMDAGTIEFYKNGASQGVAYTGISGTYAFGVSVITSPGSWILNFGQRPFAYPAPSGFRALCTTNLPEPVVAKPSEVMDVKLYTGNGSTQTISGLGFSPDLVWIKNRAQADNHKLLDTVRGATNELESNTTDAEVANTDGLTAFNPNGFDLGADVEYNTSSEAYVAWAWDAGSSTVTNTQGSITSQVRANPSAGFSIVTYGGNSTAGATVGHGLGVTPAMIILKNRSDSANWIVSHAAYSNTSLLFLDSTSAAVNSVGTRLQRTSSTVFTVGDAADYNVSNQSPDAYIAYCFAPVAGYSAFGSYVGNGSADGPFVYTGFRPRWVMIKCSSSGGANLDWFIYDTERDNFNVGYRILTANSSGAETVATGGTYTDMYLDILSCGFKVRTNYASHNGNASTYVWAAFAEHSFQYARAR